MSFHDVQFPTAISLGASGGPERRTEIVALGSGYEERNTPWSQSRRRYNAGYGVKSRNDIYSVIEFFEARRGRLYGFRWKDYNDFKSGQPLNAITASDQVIGSGDGVTTDFQLVKTYTSGTISETREIKKPIKSTLLVAVDSVDQQIDIDFTLDDGMGLITFLPSSIPGGGQTITAGFEFDVPVRFDTDYLSINQIAFSAGEIPAIPIVELRI
jgi:uncharacterized protein (TIGR02217 family)